jgi:hypothetical protein
MTDLKPLSAVEAFVLQAPQRARGPAAVKLAMLTLLAQGSLIVASEPGAGFLGYRRNIVTLRVAPKEGPDFPGATALLTLVGRDCTMRQFVERARRQYGTALRGYVDREVSPALQRRGLVEPAIKRLFGVFPRQVWRATAAGELEVAGIKRAIAEAMTIPDWLNHDPAQAAALAATLGTAILLADGLKPHYRRLAEAMRQQQGDGGGDATTDLSTVFVPAGGAASGQALADFFCPGDFDFAALDALDGGFDAFDAGFSDAGGDGGGGDGGGDGGGSGC